METGALAQRIRAFRKLKGLTQTDLAEAAEISIGILGEIERGHRAPTKAMIRRLAEVLGVQVKELIGSQEGGS